MLVKHEFSAKTDARAKKKNKNLSHVHDMWRGKKKERTAALCAAFFSARRSSPAIKAV
jgi:hypothetical protein